jgi:hypothetical protein
VHLVAPNEYVEIGSGVPIESEDLVEFHLLYSGPLHSAGHEWQRAEKHNIRKVFHSQLRHLWTIHPNLRQRAEGIGALEHGSSDLPHDELFQKGVKHIGSNWDKNGFNFIPLVTKALCLRCSLDILFLRRDERPFVLHGGDIDGRLKILFDALRMTDQKQELPPGIVPEPSECPFFCLLEDDKLISEVHIKTGPLLMLPGSLAIDEHEVYLEIGVRLNATQRVSHSWVFD